MTLPGGQRQVVAIAGLDLTTDVGVAVSGSPSPVTLDTGPTRTGGLVLAVGSGKGGRQQPSGVVAQAGPAWRAMRGGQIDTEFNLDIRLRRHAEGGLVH